MSNNSDIRKYLNLFEAINRMTGLSYTLNDIVQIVSKHIPKYDYVGKVAESEHIVEYRWVLKRDDLPLHAFTIKCDKRDLDYIQYRISIVNRKKPLDLYKLSSNPENLEKYGQFELPTEEKLVDYFTNIIRVDDLEYALLNLKRDGDL